MKLEEWGARGHFKNESIKKLWSFDKYKIINYF